MLMGNDTSQGTLAITVLSYIVAVPYSPPAHIVHGQHSIPYLEQPAQQAASADGRTNDRPLSVHANGSRRCTRPPPSPR